MSMLLVIRSMTIIGVMKGLMGEYSALDVAAFSIVGQDIRILNKRENSCSKPA